MYNKRSIQPYSNRCHTVVRLTNKTKEQVLSCQQTFPDKNQLKILGGVTLWIPLPGRILCIDKLDMLHRDTFNRVLAIFRAAIREFHWHEGTNTTHSFTTNQLHYIKISHSPIASPLARSLTPLTHSLAPHCSLRSRAPLRSITFSLAYSLAPELMGKKFLSMKWTRQFHPLSIHCAPLPLIN